MYAWTGTPERHFGALTWLVSALVFAGAQVLAGDDARRVATVAAGAMGVAGAWALAEAFGWQPIHLTGAGTRPVGTFGSSASLGASAALLGPLALGIALDVTRSSRVRALGAVSGALAGTALVTAGARAAWAGALVALVVLAMTRRRALPPRRVLTGGVAGLCAAVAVAALAGVAGRVPDAISEDDGGIRGRLDEWRIAQGVIADDPLLGVGPEGYRIVFGAHVDDRYEQAHGRHPLPDRAHSTPLDVAVTLGVPGLVAFAALVALTGRFVWRGLRRGPSWIAGAAAGLLAYGVQSLFLFPLAELEPVAWLLAGLVVAHTASPTEQTHVWIPRVVPVAVAALAAVALVAGLLDVIADRDARTTLAAVSAGRLPGGGDAAGLRPDAVRYHLVAARAHAAAGTVRGVDLALADIRAALDVSPDDPVAGNERARLLLERALLTDAAADIAAARSALASRLAADPRNAELLLRAGVAANLAGDGVAAERAWLAAERLAPRSAAASVDLAAFYAKAGRLADARAAARRALARDPGNERAKQVLARIRRNLTCPMSVYRAWMASCRCRWYPKPTLVRCPVSLRSPTSTAMVATELCVPSRSRSATCISRRRRPTRPWLVPTNAGIGSVASTTPAGGSTALR